LEQCVGHSFKTIGHSLKISAFSQKTLRPLVSQAGYGPEFTRIHPAHLRNLRPPYSHCFRPAPASVHMSEETH